MAGLIGNITNSAPTKVQLGLGLNLAILLHLHLRKIDLYLKDPELGRIAHKGDGVCGKYSGTVENIKYISS